MRSGKTKKVFEKRIKAVEDNLLRFVTFTEFKTIFHSVYQSTFELAVPQANYPYYLLLFTS